MTQGSADATYIWMALCSRAAFNPLTPPSFEHYPVCAPPERATRPSFSAYLRFFTGCGSISAILVRQSASESCGPETNVPLTLVEYQPDTTPRRSDSSVLTWRGERFCMFQLSVRIVRSCIERRVEVQFCDARPRCRSGSTGSLIRYARVIALRVEQIDRTDRDHFDGRMARRGTGNHDHGGDAPKARK